MNDHFIGKPKTVIASFFEDYIEFAHWLYIPTLNLLFAFDRQLCCHVLKLE